MNTRQSPRIANKVRAHGRKRATKLSFSSPTRTSAVATAVTLAARSASGLVTSPYFTSPPPVPATPTPTTTTTRIRAIVTPQSRTPKSPRAIKSRLSSSPSSDQADDHAAKRKQLNRTQSFEPVWAGAGSIISSEDLSTTAAVSVHTLILGTHPSIASLAEQEYFGHTMNAFWWVAGDCLGFRRNCGISASSGEPYKFTTHLRHGEDKILPYEEQVRAFTSRGFALWDIIESCEREGSLDSAIKKERPNDIRAFCNAHPSVRRIVLANGGSGCTMFNRYFKDWWESGDLMPGRNEQSVKAFQKYAKKADNFKNGKIECISALSVSPAAAKFTYKEKRDFWDKFVYRPGLEDHKKLQSL